MGLPASPRLIDKMSWLQLLCSTVCDNNRMKKRFKIRFTNLKTESWESGRTRNNQVKTLKTETLNKLNKKQQHCNRLPAAARFCSKKILDHQLA